MTKHTKLHPHSYYWGLRGKCYNKPNQTKLLYYPKPFGFFLIENWRRPPENVSMEQHIYLHIGKIYNIYSHICNICSSPSSHMTWLIMFCFLSGNTIYIHSVPHNGLINNNLAYNNFFIFFFVDKSVRGCFPYGIRCHNNANQLVSFTLPKLFGRVYSAFQHRREYSNTYPMPDY